ncbi:DNA-3-methyladenine glycosylase [Flavihumibacter rivuli]|uniref:DNA-3-methyladenine glycosylase n=1 Tax=Flavihumibacter rivuli TaxID=2838156 RepID=UPI001EFA8B7F|nr:DNA-3-methyladenine glycosylase [Flavihumibacter rivuli]ULQ54932.1 DNA-3-methyladenine glycosylase [Flavihumibacter rivuli]
MMRKLGTSFFQRPDVVELARELVGKVLVTNFNGMKTSGRIVETEAYNGIVDKASHAFGGRRTARTEVMYAPGGTAYVYLCYGIHHLFNIVTNLEDIPHAVLVRAIHPLEGIPVMLERMGKPKQDHTIGRGPGNLSKALGISTLHTGLLLNNEIYIADDGYAVSADQLVATPRIGVDYAGEDAKLPYRFYLQGDPYVSGKKFKT